MKKVAVFLLAVLILGVIIFAFQFRTGKVVTDLPDKFNVGDDFKASLVISIEQGDKIVKDTPVRIAITKEGYVIAENTLRFGEFIAMSDNPIVAIRDGDEAYYEAAGRYSVPLGKVLPYKFESSGEYELAFTVVSEGLDVRRKFIVE